MFARMAEADPLESRNTGIEMTASQFAAAHWVAEFLGSRTIDTETPPSAEDETRELGYPIPLADMAPA